MRRRIPLMCRCGSRPSRIADRRSKAPARTDICRHKPQARSLDKWKKRKSREQKNIARTRQELGNNASSHCPRRRRRRGSPARHGVHEGQVAREHGRRGNQVRHERSAQELRGGHAERAGPVHVSARPPRRDSVRQVQGGGHHRRPLDRDGRAARGDAARGHDRRALRLHRGLALAGSAPEHARQPAPSAEKHAVPVRRALRAGGKPLRHRDQGARGRAAGVRGGPDRAVRAPRDGMRFIRERRDDRVREHRRHPGGRRKRSRAARLSRVVSRRRRSPCALSCARARPPRRSRSQPWPPGK